MKHLAWLVLLAALAAPSPGMDRPALHVWGPGVEKSQDTFGFDAEVAAFEKRFNCRVVRLSMGAGSMDPQKLSTAIAGGVPPSLVRQDRFTVGDWASRGAFQPLDDLIARDRANPAEKSPVRPQDFYEACWKEAVYEGKVYAIPDSTDDRALYWNKAAFREAGLDPEKPPRTWEEMEVYAAKLTKRGKDGRLTRVGFLPNFGNVWLYMYSWQNGGEFMSPDGRTCTMANPRTVEALAWMRDLQRSMGTKQELDAFTSGFRGNELDPFFVGKIAMKVDGNWFLNGLMRYGPQTDFGVAPAPVPAARLRGEGRFAGEPPFITWSGGFSWVIPTGVTGAERDLAWEFIKFDNSLEAQRIKWIAQRAEYQKQGKPFVPDMRANRVVSEAIVREFTPRRPRVEKAMGVFQELMKYSKFRPVTFVGQRLWDEHVRAFEDATWGKDPEMVLKRGQVAVQKELDRTFIRERFREVPGWVYTTVRLVGIVFVAAALAWVVWRTRQLGRNGRAETRAAYLFAAPWIIGFVVFTLGPILVSVLLSFCDYDVLHPARWVGLHNYAQLTSPANDGPLVWKSFKNVIYLSVIGIPLTMMTGLAIALLLNAKVRGMHWYRTSYYLPAITPVVANAILWGWLLNPQFGLIDMAWGATLTKWFGWAPPNWMTDPQWSKPAFIVMGIWGAGSSMILWLAGLQGIPQHLYEAAELDGAGVWSKFWNVMVPMLTPTIFFLFVMGVIGSLQFFEIAYIMKGAGNPLGYPADSTMMPVVLLFQNAFQYFKMGYASALAWILFVVILAITLVQLKMSSRWVHYGE